MISRMRKEERESEHAPPSRDGNPTPPPRRRRRPVSGTTSAGNRPHCSAHAPISGRRFSNRSDRA